MISKTKFIQITYGGIFGMLASLMGSMFPLPRVIYAIAVDGLLFDIFAQIHPRFKTPFWGTLLAGLLTGSLAAFFDLAQLINMMSIGTVRKIQHHKYFLYLTRMFSVHGLFDCCRLRFTVEIRS